MMLLDLRLLPDLPELILVYSDGRVSGAGLVSAWKEMVRWRVSDDSLAVWERWQQLEGRWMEKKVGEDGSYRLHVLSALSSLSRVGEKVTTMGARPIK
jgi:hypothetical protein